MAAKNKTPEKILFTKYQGSGGKFYRGEFIQLDSAKFLVRISEQINGEKTIVEQKHQSRIHEVDMLRPGKNIKGAENRAKAQQAIDEYLTEKNISVLEATKKVLDKDKKEIYKIEADLGIEVEYYLKEERRTEIVDIERLSNEVSFKQVDEVAWFCRLQAFQFRKVLVNMIENL